MPKKDSAVKTKIETTKNDLEDIELLDEKKISILLKEYDSLRAMLSQAEAGIRNSLNSYLTFLSFVVGGVILIAQLSASASITITYSQLVISGLLFFGGVIGIVYSISSALIYTDLVRYGVCLDELRRFLIHTLNVPTPLIYHSLLFGESTRKEERWLLMVFSLFWPVGLVQLFTAGTSSLALAVGTFLILASTNSLSGSFNSSVAIFGITFLTLNMSSRILMYLMGSRLGASFDIGRSKFPLFKRGNKVTSSQSKADEAES